MITKAELITIRNYRPEDEDFVFSTFLLGLYHGDTWFSKIKKPVFLHHYRLILKQLLNHPNVKINVSCLKDDADVILGYSVLSKNEQILHWVFIKSAWRKIGIARSLVPNTINTVTHLTAVGLSLLKKYDNVSFNPFVL